MNPADAGPEPRALRLLTLAACISALWTLLTTIAAAMAAYSSLPYEDEWDTWLTFLRRRYSFGWFFALHNDHRIAAPRVLFAVDHLAFGGQRWFLLASAFVLQASLAGILWRLARRSLGYDRRQDAIVGAAIVCCLFSAQQALNFYWAFQVQFFMVYTAGAAALFALLRSSEAGTAARRMAWFGASLLCACVCTYSMANGVLIWPALLLFGAQLKVPRSELAWAAAGTVSLPILYFHGWHVSKLDAAAPLARVALFALANLGSPLVPLLASLGAGVRLQVFATALLGAALFTATAIAWISVCRRPDRFGRERVALVHFAVFVAAASFAIASGRAHLALDAAFRSRYITPPYILWSCLLILVWPRLRSWRPPAAAGVLCAALILGVALQQNAKVRESAAYGAGFHRGETMVADGVSDPEVWPFIFRSAAEAAPAVDYLRAEHLSIFAAEWTHWPGLTLASRFAFDGSNRACVGDIAEATQLLEPPQPGWRLSGQAGNPRGGPAPGFVVLADPAGRILGVAPVESRRWQGYVPGVPPSITAYAVLPGAKSVCAFATRALTR